MKRYLLLRNNRESGPFLLEDLICQDLCPLDLVWIDGESRSWVYANEPEELKVWVKETPQKIVLTGPVKTRGREPSPMEGIPLPTLSPLRERRWEAPSEKKRIWGRRISRSTNAGNLLRLATVLILIAPSAFIIKKLVDAFSGSENYNPPVVANFTPEHPTENRYSMAIAHHNSATSANTVEKSLLKPEINEIRGKISVKSNDYNVNFLGGIDDLKLTVVNLSPYYIDNVVITIQFYRRNGNLAETEQVQVEKLNPGATQIIAVPPVKKGVRVSYSVKHIRSGQQTYTLKQV